MDHSFSLESVWELSLMCDAAEEKASHCHMDHGLGDVETLLKDTREPAPTDHPAQGSFDDPPARQHFEARLAIDTSDNLDDEVEERRLVEQLVRS
jgi:hypothetical protein